ncbi:glycosyltransferase, SP_1767 family [Butyrivibrio fibrisolvens DSM 3071]|uniref:Glycosyltransferase, SP_1767 family n=1 Tax=Butyrivibrio fibrisolvens DSM 3071 TaxID=1121131 RepID=A0A1M5YYB2_BUTFI|nr:GT-D fold domain-containing glycosyltransferase [Butyrivibrio fibrisolvens]SHI16920.1 glycosyltransferase, SP_1767 family [Butyrivibrio fibrisolvens DSM 3071]
MRVYIYGRGLGFKYVKRCLLEQVEIIAYIDNYAQDKVSGDGISIIKKDELLQDFDFIIITLMKYEVVRSDLLKQGIGRQRIISFFDREDAEKDIFYSVLDSHRWKSELMWKYQQEVEIPRADNAYYEANAKELEERYELPTIIDVDKTIDILIGEEKSLTRFGDGEFEMMFGRNRPRFQVLDKKLGNRLCEALQKSLPNLMIAIADNYGDLSKYTDEAADAIRHYMSPEVRKNHMSLLDMHRCYYDAYLSRPYYIYRDKSFGVIKRKFDHIKEIWSGKDVLIVEGEHTRFGVSNDLMDGATSVVRLLVPDKNAFSKYDAIIEATKKYGYKRLIICVIGPTATILVFDLAKMGYRAIDIGQLDTEYEWFLREAKDKCDVSYKTVSEFIDKEVYEDISEPYKSIYEEQIVEIIK